MSYQEREGRKAERVEEEPDAEERVGELERVPGGLGVGEALEGIPGEGEE